MNRDLILAIIVIVLIGLLIMQHFMTRSEPVPLPSTQVPSTEAPAKT